MAISDPTVAFERLLEALDHLGVRYGVGGSLASSIRGTGRATMDIDLVVELRPAQAEDLALALQGDFSAKAARLRAPVERRPRCGADSRRPSRSRLP